MIDSGCLLQRMQQQEKALHASENFRMKLFREQERIISGINIQHTYGNASTHL